MNRSRAIERHRGHWADSLWAMPMNSEPCQPQMLQPHWCRRATAPTIGRSGERPPHGRSLGSRSERAATRSTVVILIPSASHLLRVQTDLPLRRMGGTSSPVRDPRAQNLVPRSPHGSQRHFSCPPHVVAVEEQVLRPTPSERLSFADSTANAVGPPNGVKPSPWGRRDSNPHCGRFKRPASADWATPPAPPHS
jgi:hypothetical protein